MIVTEDQIRPWLDLVEYLIPNKKQRHHLLQWMGFVMRNQHIKVNHAILIGGDERIGKDTIVVPITRFIGEENTSVVSADRLEENFNDFFVCKKLVLLQEIHAASYKDAKKVENKLKPLLASPPDTLRLPRKGQTDMIQPNLLQMIAFSNYRDALHLSSEGSRYFCIWSDARRKEDSYYESLYHWMEGTVLTINAVHYTGVHMVAKWLLQYDLTGFKPKAPAPSTPWREAMTEESKTDLERDISEILDDLHSEGVKYTTAGKVKQLYDRSHATGKPASVQRLARVMGNMRVGRVGDSQLNFPKIFLESDGLPVTPENFKKRTKSNIYATNRKVTGIISEDVEAVHESLCPDYMRDAYKIYVQQYES